jgi:hypothetical protein
MNKKIFLTVSLDEREKVMIRCGGALPFAREKKSIP